MVRFHEACHQKKFSYRSRVPSIASSEKNTANKQKRVSKAIVQQTGAQFYYRFVEGIKQRIRVAQIKAAISANRELILLYWDIGRAIVDAQKDKGYGKRVVEILSTDLRRNSRKWPVCPLSTLADAGVLPRVCCIGPKTVTACDRIRLRAETKTGTICFRSSGADCPGIARTKNCHKLRHNPFGLLSS